MKSAHGTRDSRRRQAGFNMLELMITITIAGIVLAAGIPSFNGLLATNRMAAAANDIITSINTARGEAVKRRQPGAQAVTLCLSANWNTANPACDLAGGANDGWIIFIDQNANAAVNGGDTVVQAHGPLATGVIAQRWPPASSAYLQFGSNGFPRAVAGLVPFSNVRLCDSRGNVDTGGGVAAARSISIAANGPGRPQLYRMVVDIQNAALNPSGVCP